MAFEFDHKEGQSIAANVVIYHMRAKDLPAFESEEKRDVADEPIVKDTMFVQPYAFQMTLQYGTAKNIQDAEKYDIVFCQYGDAMMAAWYGVKSDEKLKKMPMRDMDVLTQAAARLAFDYYAEHAYPQDKGFIEKQNPTGSKGVGYEFQVNREAMHSPRKNEKRSGPLRLVFGMGHDAIPGSPSLHEDDVIFKKDDDAFVLHVKLER